MGRTDRMKVFGYEAEFKDSVYIDYVLLKDKKKKKRFSSFSLKYQDYFLDGLTMWTNVLKSLLER